MELNKNEITPENDPSIPELAGKDMMVVMFLLLKKVGMIQIPQEVFDNVPEDVNLHIERQWDGVNKVWRFFVREDRKRGKVKPHLHLPADKKVITNFN